MLRETPGPVHNDLSKIREFTVCVWQKTLNRSKGRPWGNYELNCASSVDPNSAIVDEAPPVITKDTSSKYPAPTSR